ncbi:NAD(P)/FAD-dependent oxidoreductase [Aeromicrobium camelliae]|uniref:NAD(P)/FAD-dependent oxidoreductase n=1 Tax=Aeromicrobium camelliae TaxID=1538144 RepID=A0A3N6WYS9_9ACTN|nr:NAD(P)/FAD-dependent oxidoreductase [Aeromicrobium camelliae]RQN10192.1 NAD(P)/FAD-dependent oxidoreductase [Aeromicrobium camelliae]
MSTDHVDVLIVGAGLSGIGAAYRLQEMSPGKTYAVLEQREQIGGTWDLFRYPGVRSDSDMYTLSYPFRPWTNEKAIADGGDIRQYIVDTAREAGIAPHIRYGRRVESASWSSEDALWTVTSRLDDGSTETVTASFLYLCSGYYSYDEGYTPPFRGIEDYEGRVVHPQFWPEDLDYAGKNVVIIGSGATAITLLPSMARDAAKVTMLQRSPTYILSQPGKDPIANVARRLLPQQLVHRATRLRYAVVTVGFYVFCRTFPKLARRILLGLAQRQAPELDSKHLSPYYKPWDQRLCVVPGGDLWRVVREGKADIVTDHIEEFTPKGIALKSGEHLDADIVVTATGLQLVALGQIDVSVDGRTIDPHELYTYKGLMFSGVPNLAWCVGYTNASWTLRADLTWKYVARYLNHLDEHGYAYGMPDPAGASGDPAPILDLESNYIKRVEDKLPLQGSRRPWTIRQNWFLDAWDARRTDLDEEMIWVRRSELGGEDPRFARSSSTATLGG